MSSWGPESQDFESGLLGESTQPITVLFPLPGPIFPVGLCATRIQLSLLSGCYVWLLSSVPLYITGKDLQPLASDAAQLGTSGVHCVHPASLFQGAMVSSGCPFKYSRGHWGKLLGFFSVS